jgi:hypothetical protein
VSLGTDWGVSAPKNLLTSLKMAWELNEERKKSSNSYVPRYEAFSEYELVEMVTANPARSPKWEQYVGQLREGMFADILVIDKKDKEGEKNEKDKKDKDHKPYEALIRATEKDVQLVMVGGDPLYGDESVMTQLKPGDFELIGDGTFFKAIDVTKAGVAKGDQQFTTIQSSLSSAMNFSPFTMFATYAAVPFISSIIGPIDFNQFLFLFGYIFFDYLPDGTPFPPPPPSLLSLLAPGALSLPLTPVYTAQDPAFFDLINNNPNATLPDIQTEYYSH